MTDLFDKEGNPVDQEGNPTATSENPNTDSVLAGIKDERGEQKFKTDVDLARGYQASQDFIATLKAEKDAVAAELAEAQSKVMSQEDLAQLLAEKNEPDVIEKKVEVPVGLDAAGVMQLLEQREAASTAATNVGTVKSAFAEKFGADANAKLVELTAAAGLSKEMAQTLASESPEALLKIVGVDTPHTVASLQGSVNTTAMRPASLPDASKVMGAKDTKSLVSEFKASAERSLQTIEQ